MTDENGRDTVDIYILLCSHIINPDRICITYVLYVLYISLCVWSHGHYMDGRRDSIMYIWYIICLVEINCAYWNTIRAVNVYCSIMNRKRKKNIGAEALGFGIRLSAIWSYIILLYMCHYKLCFEE